MVDHYCCGATSAPITSPTITTRPVTRPITSAPSTSGCGCWGGARRRQRAPRRAEGCARGDHPYRGRGHYPYRRVAYLGEPYVRGRRHAARLPWAGLRLPAAYAPLPADYPPLPLDRDTAQPAAKPAGLVTWLGVGAGVGVRVGLGLRLGSGLALGLGLGSGSGSGLGPPPSSSLRRVTLHVRCLSPLPVAPPSSSEDKQRARLGAAEGGQAASAAQGG